jgi:antitoxin ParD1/3/4
MQEDDMATMNVSLPDPMKHWVEAQTRTGRYSNASDYVRDLIRRDQERVAGLTRLQNAITGGIDSGIAEGFSMADLQAELDTQDG